MADNHPVVTSFYDKETNSIAYVAEDPATRRCALIDPVLDFDRACCATHTGLAERMVAFVRERGLTVEWILDTHPHADHFSAAPYLKGVLGAPTAIGEHVVTVQRIWKEIYHLPDFPADGSQWDRLFKDGDRFRVGALEGAVIFSPGHTAASITYVVGDAAFIHDTLFVPDSGTARADFPGGDAAWGCARRCAWRAGKGFSPACSPSSSSPSPDICSTVAQAPRSPHERARRDQYPPS
jgi:glyoxylase-like metal-dependent hydrolase (beta-lactamase superfamily II)